MQHSEYGVADAKGNQMNYNKLKNILQKNIKEQNSSYSDPDGGFSFADGSIAPFAVEDPQVIARLNSFLKAFSLERHQDAKNAVAILRTKLNTIGLDFPYDGRRPLSGKEVFNMTLFGGRQGMNDKGEMFSDSGISHRTGGKELELHVDITPLNAGETEPGPYYISAKLHYGSNSSVVLQPEKLSAAKTLGIKEEKDACYHKVKSRYDVWPSAYASGALSKCRSVGADNWGNKSKKEKDKKKD